MIYMRWLAKRMASLFSMHRVLIPLMIVLVSCGMSILGLVMNQGQAVEESIADYSDTYGRKTYYFTNEGLSDMTYYQYLEDENVGLYHSILQFRNALLADSRISFFTLMNQPVEIYSQAVPEMFLDGYEEGNADSSVFDFEGRTLYLTKALQVSEAFFREMNIKAEKGREFQEPDYIYKQGEKIPVIIGSGYEDVFQIGDVIGCNYLFEDVSLEVIGILQKDAFFYDSMNGDFKSCERYLLMPALQSADDDFFGKVMLLQQMKGILISDLGYPQTKELFDGLLYEFGIKQSGIYMSDPAATISAANLLNTYSSMTQEVSKQFQMIVALLLLFVVLSIASVLCGFIRERKYEYGIQMLCGAKPIQILGDMLLLDFVILLSGWMIAGGVLLINFCSKGSILATFLVTVLLAVLIAAVLFGYLYRMDVGEIIGGNE
ncbi:MAG: hypothetical protein IJ711_07705 [Lachnospiraceae bacterium]|nr:hypothetical protein [Lachnospiraceae bacterium]